MMHLFLQFFLDCWDDDQSLYGRIGAICVSVWNVHEFADIYNKVLIPYYMYVSHSCTKLQLYDTVFKIVVTRILVFS